MGGRCLPGCCPRTACSAAVVRARVRAVCVLSSTAGSHGSGFFLNVVVFFISVVFYTFVFYTFAFVVFFVVFLFIIFFIFFIFVLAWFLILDFAIFFHALCAVSVPFQRRN